MKGWRPELVILLLLLLGAGLGYLVRHPVQRPSQEQEQVATDLTRPGQLGDPRSSFLLLLDARVIDGQAQQPELVQRDWSYAWINWLEQEFGSYRILDPGALGSDAAGIEAVRLAIISRSAWSGLNPLGRAALDSLTSRGGVIIAETPPPGMVLPGEPERIIVFDEPFSTALVRLQQGWPADRPDAASGRATILTESLAFTHEAELWSPVADHLERDLLARVERLMPVARWWPFPDAAAGVVALTYDEQGFGERASWMARHDRSREVEGTLFVEPRTASGAALKHLLPFTGPPGLAWARTPADQPEMRWGLGPLPLFSRPATLREQLALLASFTPHVPPATLSRTAGTRWEPSFGLGFRRLAAAGLRADCSYGPGGEERVGYLFGTGLPFHPLDINGRPFSLLEVPFLFRNDGRYGRSIQQRLLKGSLEGDHQLIVGAFSVDFMARVPSLERMEAWLELPSLARQQHHQVLSLPAFLAHWQARLDSTLQQRWDPAAAQLTVQVQAQAKGLTLVFSPRAADGGLVQLSLDGQVLPESEWRRWGLHSLVSIEPGVHVVQASYFRKRSPDHRPKTGSGHRSPEGGGRSGD